MNNNTTHTTENDVRCRSDAELLERWVVHRDADALTGLVERYRTLVTGVCLRQCRRRVDVEDAFQATFLQLSRSAEKIKQPSALPGWLHAVAYRTAIRTRKMYKHNSLETVDLSSDDVPLKQLANRHELQVLDDELVRLGDQERIPLVLRYFEELSVGQIADRLGMSIGAVRGRLQRGKRRLRLRLLRRGINLSAAIAALNVLPYRVVDAAGLVHRTIDICLADGSLANGMQALSDSADRMDLGDATPSGLQAEIQRLETLLRIGDTSMSLSRLTIAGSLGSALLLIGLVSTFAGSQGLSTSEVYVGETKKGTENQPIALRALPGNYAVATAQFGGPFGDGPSDNPNQPADQPAPQAGSTDPFGQQNFAGGMGGMGGGGMGGMGGGGMGGMGGGGMGGGGLMGFPFAGPARLPQAAAKYEPSTIDIELEDKLSQPRSQGLRLSGLSIRELAEMLRAESNLPVVVDMNALEQAGIDAQATINTDLPGTSLRGALNSALREHGLKVLVRDDAIQIAIDYDQLALHGAKTTQWVNVDDEIAERILTQLNQPVDFKFEQIPLIDAVQALSQDTQLFIKLDARAMEDIGLTIDIPVTGASAERSLLDGLNSLLSENDLTLTFAQNAIVVTTHENSQSGDSLLQRIYWLDGTGVKNAEYALALLETMVDSQSWESFGGPGVSLTLSDLIPGRTGIVVNQTLANHLGIEKLLNSLRRAHGAKGL